MRKILFILAALCITGCVLTKPPESHADIFAYPCQYPAVGMGADVAGAGGQFCDYPTEINGTHYHCQSGGFHAGGLGLAGTPLPGGGILNLGGLATLGAGGESCDFRCPDNTLAPFPNPPGMWKTYMVVLDKNNDCLDHMQPAGLWSVPAVQDPGPPGQPKPEEYPGPLPGVPPKPVGDPGE